MGWERKRGKLLEFNRLLRGATDTSFTVQLGDLSVLPSVKYVITLDSDTQLPLEAARRLVGTLSHPLEPAALRPVGAARDRGLRHSPAARRGQHRQRQPLAVRADLLRTRRHRSRTRPRCPTSIRISSTRAATSARASTTSTRSRRRSAGRVPDNTLLSHDLFEGFVRARRRCAPTSTLVDDYPSHYLSFAARQHRWVRGDWQIARWLWRDGARRARRRRSATRCRRSRAGRSSTTCGAA